MSSAWIALTYGGLSDLLACAPMPRLDVHRTPPGAPASPRRVETWSRSGMLKGAGPPRRVPLERVGAQIVRVPHPGARLPPRQASAPPPVYIVRGTSVTLRVRAPTL